jgi:NAD/NADP transhydrogenase beta subunit
MLAADRRGSRADKRGVSPVPVLVALLTALAGASSATVGLVLGSTAMMFAGMVVGGMGSVLIQLIGKATSRRRQAVRYEKGA